VALADVVDGIVSNESRGSPGTPKRIPNIVPFFRGGWVVVCGVGVDLISIALTMPRPLSKNLDVGFQNRAAHTRITCFHISACFAGFLQAAAAAIAYSFSVSEEGS